MAGSRNLIVVSYSHEDATWMKKVRDHLRPVSQSLDVELWDDTALRVGEEWKPQIWDAFAAAKVVIPLISAAYLASDFTASTELPLVKAATSGGATILPLIVGYSDFQHSPWAQFQAANDPNQPLESLSPVEVARTLVGVAKTVRGVLVRSGLENRVSRESKDPAPAALNRALFICYRREDTQDAAGRLRDRLVIDYGQERVFMDIDSVPLGIDFVEHVTEQIGKCNAVIVMIGKQWHAIKDKKRRRRLDKEDDLVRAEIRAALQQKVPVIPVTVQNAPMPQAEDLPDDIRLLARRNGIDLSATRWTTDVERLIKELDRVMKLPSGS